MAGFSQTWTLKIQLNGEVRRLRGWPENECEPTVEALHSAIRSLFDLTTEVLSLKYEDDDGDLCTLVEASLSDALSFATQRGLLRIIATCSQTCPNSPGPSRELAREVVACESIPPCAPAETHPRSECTLQEDESPAEAEPASVASDAEPIPDAPEEPLNASERLTQHFENARPHIAEGFAHFKQQVTNDFQSTSEDMKDAFGAGAQQRQVLGSVSVAVGAAAGIISAARLVPIRATKLAAHSVAVIAGRDVTSEDVAGEQGEATDNGASASSEFDHLKQQVTNDFCSVQQDLNSAFRCILGDNRPASSAPSFSAEHTPDAQEPEPPVPTSQTLKIAIPNIFSTFAGASVAACLLPVRATRFAVANLASSLGSPPASDEQQS